jgi:ABC-type multidrug transport system fused ATPase/permease subunit
VSVSASPSVARKLWGLLSPRERANALLLLFLMFVGMLLESLGIGLVVPLITLFTQPTYIDRVPALRSLLDYFGNPGRDVVIVGAILALVVIYLVKALFLAFLVWRQTRFAFEVQAQLSQRLFTNYLRQPYAFHLRRNSAQLLRNVTGEIGIFTNNAMIPGLLLVTESMVLVGLCALLLLVQPVGAVITFSSLALAGLVFHRLTRRAISRWGLARLHHEGMRIQHLQQGLGAAKDVKLLGREGEFLEQYRRHNVHFTRAAQLQSTLEQLPRLWLEVLAVAALAVLVVAMRAQGKAIDAVLPTLGLFAAAAFRIAPSANRLIVSIQSLRYGLPVVDTLYQELQYEAPPPKSRVAGRKPFAGQLELENVSLRYEGAPGPSLDSVSVTVGSGESVGFIGPSGAGKSTLVDVILGLLLPDSGIVRVDGRDIREDVRGWQDQIGYVPQSIFLADDTLRRNVAFGLADDHIDEQAILRALRAAQLEEFVRALPEGLDTSVGERGIRLSGGQRQRIGIARALYHDPPVIVLDEATSSLDVDAERNVMEAVEALHGVKTIVIVAHRLSTTENCDRLYRLERGRIVSAGAPRDVLRA